MERLWNNRRTCEDKGLDEAIRIFEEVKRSPGSIGPQSEAIVDRYLKRYKLWKSDTHEVDANEKVQKIQSVTQRAKTAHCLEICALSDT